MRWSIAPVTFGISRFRVQGSEFRVQSSGFSVQSSSLLIRNLPNLPNLRHLWISLSVGVDRVSICRAVLDRSHPQIGADYADQKR